MARLRHYLAVAALALWWGGFTFYALVVVPTGHHVLRSKVRQGFITQEVTNKLNIVGVVALLLLLWELIAARRNGSSPALARVAWSSWAGLAITLATLTWMHPRLDSLLDPVNRIVTDDSGFYEWHRLYLIVATVQWLAGLTHLAALITPAGTKAATAAALP